MPKIRIHSTGDVLNIPEGADIDAAVAQYEQQYTQRYGMSVAEKKEADLQQNIETERQRGHDEFMEERPIAGQVASFQAGAKNLGRNLAQMALPKSLEKRLGFTDEDLAESNDLEKNLKEDATAAYTAGEIIPSLAGGIAAKVPQLAARALPLAMAEGGTLGAALAGPDDRVQGAVTGAVTAGGLHGAGRVLRRAIDGIAPPSKLAASAMQKGAQTPQGGVEPFIPLSRSANKVGKGSKVRHVYDKVLDNFPAASRNLAKQSEDAVKATYENMLRQGYGKHADDVLAKYRDTDSLLDAAKFGEKLVAESPVVGSNRIREVLLKAGESGKRGNPTLAQISGASRTLNAGKGSQPLKRMADEMDELTARPPGEGNVVLRKVLYGIVNYAGALLPSAAAKALTSKGFQKALMGNTQAQKTLQKALQSGDKVMLQETVDRLLRTIAVEDVQNSADDIKQTLGELADA